MLYLKTKAAGGDLNVIARETAEGWCRTNWNQSQLPKLRRLLNPPSLRHSTRMAAAGDRRFRDFPHGRDEQRNVYSEDRDLLSAGHQRSGAARSCLLLRLQQEQSGLGPSATTQGKMR